MNFPFDYYNKGRIDRYGVNPSSDLSHLESFVNSFRRIWLITNRADIVDPKKKIENWLKQHTKRLETKSFYRIQVNSYKNQ